MVIIKHNFRAVLAICFAIGLSLVFSCGANKESDDSTSSADQNPKRPSEDPENPPGYMIDPEAVAVKVDHSNNRITLDAPSATIVFSKGGVASNTFINVWQASTEAYSNSIKKPDSNKGLLLSAVHKISMNPNADGSFKIEFQNSVFSDGSLGTMVLSITSAKQEGSYVVSQIHSDGTSAFVRNLDADEPSKAIKNYRFVLPKDFGGDPVSSAPSDTTAPSSPSGFFLDKSWSDAASSPPLAWGAPQEGDVSHYELSISLYGSNTYILPNTNIGLVTSYQAGGLSLVSGEKYSVLLSAVDKSGNKSSTQSSFENLICPAGYVKVIGNKTSKLGGTAYSTGTKGSRRIADFCVMKYEAKIVGKDNGQSGNPTSDVVESRAVGTPWVGISRDQAKARCTALGAGYNLINNAQWQALARDIESVEANWSQGSTSGDASNSLNRGHSDDADSSSGALAAINDDSLACYSIGSETFDANSVANNCGNAWHLNKRTNVLSNGQVVWDIGGNVSEWLKDDIGSVQGSDGLVLAQLWNDGATGKLEWGPAGDHDIATAGFGMSVLNASAGALSRGGKFNSSSAAGAFSLSLSDAPSASSNAIGFRCVYAP